jgi:hypothetical protein
LPLFFRREKNVTRSGLLRLFLMLCTPGPRSYYWAMEPSSRRDPQGKPEPFARELIEKEIAHLKKRRSVRNAHDEARSLSRGLMFLAIVAVLWLYCMDPFLFAYYRGDAIRTYLYLHNYGDDKKAAALAACGLLSSIEVQQLDNRAGSFQDYFNGTEAAEKKSASAISTMTTTPPSPR